MTSREAAIYQLKQLKGQPLKKKISYICTYYGVPIVAILAAVIFTVSLIVHWVTLKPSVLELYCINAVTTEQSDPQSYLQQFAQDQGIDLEEYKVTATMMFFGQGTEADYQSEQMFAAMLMAGGVDVLAADRDTIVRYAYQEAFIDLNELLTQEQMDTFAPYILYMDRSFLQELQVFSNEPIQYPDPTKPEEMEQPVPVAVILQPDWEFSKSCYPYTYGEDAVALIASGKNTANAEAFLQYILDQEGN